MGWKCFRYTCKIVTASELFRWHSVPFNSWVIFRVCEMYLRKKGYGYCTAAKIVERQTLFTIHNGVKSGTAIDLNKRGDLHNNYQTTIVRPRCSQFSIYTAHTFSCVYFKCRSKDKKNLLSLLLKNMCLRGCT